MIPDDKDNEVRFGEIRRSGADSSTSAPYPRPYTHCRSLFPISEPPSEICPLSSCTSSSRPSSFGPTSIRDLPWAGGRRVYETCGRSSSCRTGLELGPWRCRAGGDGILEFILSVWKDTRLEYHVTYQGVQLISLAYASRLGQSSIMLYKSLCTPGLNYECLER